MTIPIQDMIVQARKAQRSGDWQEACARWAEVRRVRPVHPGAYMEGIEALVRGYRLDEIDAVAAQARDHCNENFRVRMFLAALTCRQGRWAEAVEAYEEVARDFPEGRGEVEGATSYRQAVLNTEGILAGNRKLKPLTHAEFVQCPADETGPDGQEFVFVSGMPRAGTTALGHVLNAAPDIAVFTEIHIPYLTYAPASFAPDLLADRAARLPSAAPKDMLERAGRARIIGDKRPLFHYMLPQSLDALQDHRVTVFHILRPVIHVAASYHSRAMNPDDQWDPLRDLDNAIDEFNVMHRFILDWQADGRMRRDHRLVHVDYGRAFSEVDYTVSLFGHLDRPVDDKLRAALAGYVDHSGKILARPRTIAPEIRAKLLEGLDLEAARGVADLTGIDVLGELA